MLNTYNLTLADTIPYMNSSDYKERFIGEYWQTRIRYDKLHDMTVNYEAGKLNFTPSCSLELLKEQKKYMGMYLNKLEIRASIEDVDLEQPFKVKANENTSDIPFVTGLSIEGEDNHQYTIEELDSMTTSTHSDGYVAASDEKESPEDYSFEDLHKYFKVNQNITHELFGRGKIKNIWYYLSDGEICLNMDIEWDNGATMTLDTRYPEQKDIIDSLWEI